MTMRTAADRLPNQGGQNVARVLCRRLRARLVRSAGSVHLTRCNAREADARTLRTPDRAVAVPNVRRRAAEGLSGWDDCHREEQQNAHDLHLGGKRLILQSGIMEAGDSR